MQGRILVTEPKTGTGIIHVDVIGAGRPTAHTNGYLEQAGTRETSAPIAAVPNGKWQSVAEIVGDVTTALLFAGRLQVTGADAVVTCAAPHQQHTNEPTGRENVMRPPLDRTAFTVTVLPDDPAIEEKRIGWGRSRKNRKRSVRASRRRKGMSK